MKSGDQRQHPMKMRGSNSRELLIRPHGPLTLKKRCDVHMKLLRGLGV